MGCLERDAVRPSPCPSGKSCKVTSHGFCLLFGGVMFTRTLSCKVSCRVLDATPLSLTLVWRACSEGSESPEGLLNYFSLLFSSSDLLPPLPLGLSDSSEVVLLRLESTACGPVVCTAKFSPAFSSLCDSPAGARCNFSFLGDSGCAPLDGLFCWCNSVVPLRLWQRQVQ